jgi:hypothetical protein
LGARRLADAGSWKLDHGSHGNGLFPVRFKGTPPRKPPPIKRRYG